MHRDVLVFVIATILNSRACRPGPTSFLVRHEEKFLDRTRLGPTSYQIGTRGSRIRTSSSDLVSSSPQKQNFGDDEPSSVKFGRRTDHFASFFSEQKPSLSQSLANSADLIWVERVELMCRNRKCNPVWPPPERSSAAAFSSREPRRDRTATDEATSHHACFASQFCPRAQDNTHPKVHQHYDRRQQGPHRSVPPRRIGVVLPGLCPQRVGIDVNVGGVRHSPNPALLHHRQGQGDAPSGGYRRQCGRPVRGARAKDLRVSRWQITSLGSLVVARRKNVHTYMRMWIDWMQNAISARIMGAARPYSAEVDWMDVQKSRI